MPAYARKEIVADGEVGVYHCLARCVRRAYLCGQDALTGRNFEHRRAWIRTRLETLAGIFGVEVCGYAVMGNHLHAVLRTRPDVVAAWSDEQVGRRWWNLCPGRRDKQGRPAEPEEHEWRLLVADPAACAERRKRLASLSWFMRALCEPIARRANREDDCTGRFWEGRFKSQALLDEAALLACSVYVDLNPIRAGLAATPEESVFTSVHDRITARQARNLLAARRTLPKDKVARGKRPDSVRPKLPAKGGVSADGWLVAFTLEERQAKGPGAGDLAAGNLAAGDFVAAEGRRASDRGYLPLDVEAYLELVDWTGRQVRLDKRGVIPAELRPILERLAVATDGWVESVRHFGRWFHRAVGRVSNLRARASRSGKQWLHGIGRAQLAFT